MGKSTRKDAPVDLLETVETLHQYIEQASCDVVFQQVRTKERQREWTLHALVAFWTEVIIRAPVSLTHALEEASGGVGFWPKVKASPQAFFARCQDLSWKFFRSLYEAFVRVALEKESPRYANSLGDMGSRFSGIMAIDGSRLDKIAHRLKILWKERAVVLPGCLIALYDIRFGLMRHLEFCADAAAAEMTRAQGILDKIPSGVLLLGDRLYCSVEFFRQITSRGIFGVFRRNHRIKIRKVRLLRRLAYEEGVLEDLLVEAGCGVKTPVQTLRYIRWKRGRRVREFLTNVLEVERLSAEEVIQLYPWRWKIERMFYDLKEVLNLHCFYAANPNAVAMQVYAAALVHAAMRLAQGRIAQNAEVAPEDISTEKLFPRVAAASHALANAELVFLATCRLNPGVTLKKPDWRKMPFATTSLKKIRLQIRNGKRRSRRFCKSRKRWKSLAHVSGFRI